jgi:type VI secretion system protein ImpF
MAARADHERRVVLSVLDRLLDEEPKSTRDVLPTRAETVRELRRAVTRDLDTLLNTRNTFSDLSPDFTEVARSVIAYGLPDLSSFGHSPNDWIRLRQAIETAIRTFEPRLAGAVVTVTPPTSTDRSVRVRIDARLIMTPNPEPISFDIVMPFLASRCEVKERT